MNSPRIGCFTGMLASGCRSRSTPLSTSPAPFNRMPSTHGDRHDPPIPPALSCPKRRNLGQRRIGKVLESPSRAAIPNDTVSRVPDADPASRSAGPKRL